MTINSITFSIEETDGERYFVATMKGGVVYHAHISKEEEVDVFDCIEHFMQEHILLFRNNPRPRPGDELSVDRIKWTSNTTM